MFILQIVVTLRHKICDKAAHALMLGYHMIDKDGGSITLSSK